MVTDSQYKLVDLKALEADIVALVMGHDNLLERQR